jgi:hypothetical protein
VIAVLFSPKPPPAEVPSVETPAAAGRALRWRDHELLTAPSHAACLRCGAVRVARRRAHLMASPCAGQVPATGAPQLRTLLRAGVFDLALRQAPREVVGLTASLGCCAVAADRPCGPRDLKNRADPPI